MADPARQRLYTRLSVLTIMIGAALLAMMIVVEDEFGALPLLLIVFGAGAYMLVQHQGRSARKK